MKQANPTVDDSFEKARKAFFGTGKTTMNPSAPHADFLKTRNDIANPVGMQATDIPYGRLSQSLSCEHVKKVVN